jgi:hypothetical protein
MGPAGPQGPIGPQGPAGPAGASGTTGQSVTASYGSSALLVDPTVTTFTVIPGLSQTIDVPANSVLYVSTDGGVVSTDGATVRIGIFVNGVAAGPTRFVQLGTGGLGEWSLSRQVVAQGTTTIDVRAVHFAGDKAFVSATPPGADIGVLNVMVLKQ